MMVAKQSLHLVLRFSVLTVSPFLKGCIMPYTEEHVIIKQTIQPNPMVLPTVTKYWSCQEASFSCSFVYIAVKHT